MNDSADAEVVFQDLLDALRQSLWLIASLTALGALIAAGIVWLVPKQYEASTVVFATSSDSTNGLAGGLSSLASQFSGLAALAGATPQTDSKKAEAIAVLQSEQLTELYISENNLLPILYAKKWDAVNKRWKKADSDGVPTLWQANLRFRKSIRTINTDTKNGMLTLNITWTDAATAAKWANGIIKLENIYLRDKAIRESEANIAYLNSQAARTDVVGIKQVIYSILQNEINKEMIARGSEEYALKVVDPAFVPERPSYPVPVLWIVVGGLIGLFVSVFIAFLRKEHRA
jgi:uncharacterized protein involved in exopolysaccharide biosynthesis